MQQRRWLVKLPLDVDVDLAAIRQEALLWIQASRHPNVIPLIEANIYDKQIVIVSEYASDGSLEQWLKKYGGKAPSSNIAAGMVLGILAGLEHLHSRHILHRDLKPDNVLLQGTTARLADFGISRVLKATGQSSIVAGTPSYMAPETFSGKRNERTDIWSVGVILFQLLTGELPYPQTDIPALVGALMHSDPAPLPGYLPQTLREVLDCSLSKNPDKRYQSASEMRTALGRAVEQIRLGKPTEKGPEFTIPDEGDVAVHFEPREDIVDVHTQNNRSSQFFHIPRRPRILYPAFGLLVLLIAAIAIAAWRISTTISLPSSVGHSINSNSFDSVTGTDNKRVTDSNSSVDATDRAGKPPDSQESNNVSALRHQSEQVELQRTTVRIKFQIGIYRDDGKWFISAGPQQSQAILITRKGTFDRYQDENGSVQFDDIPCGEKVDIRITYLGNWGLYRKVP